MKDPKRPKGLPENATFLGRHSVLDLCADDLFRIPERGIVRLRDKDDDGGSLLMMQIRQLSDGSTHWVHARKSARVNVWAD